MKKLLSTLFVALFVGSGVIGCEANFDADHDRDGDYYKKTTTVREADGDRKVKTEIRRED